MPGTMSLEGGEGTVLETFIQGVAMPNLDIQGQELYLEDATLSSATPIFWGLHSPEPSAWVSSKWVLGGDTLASRTTALAWTSNNFHLCELQFSHL